MIYMINLYLYSYKANPARSWEAALALANDLTLKLTHDDSRELATPHSALSAAYPRHRDTDTDDRPTIFEMRTFNMQKALTY
jgi:hypothetical protein